MRPIQRALGVVLKPLYKIHPALALVASVAISSYMGGWATGLASRFPALNTLFTAVDKFQQLSRLTAAVDGIVAAVHGKGSGAVFGALASFGNLLGNPLLGAGAPALSAAAAMRALGEAGLTGSVGAALEAAAVACGTDMASLLQDCAAAARAIESVVKGMQADGDDAALMGLIGAVGIVDDRFFGHMQSSLGLPGSALAGMAAAAAAGPDALAAAVTDRIMEGCAAASRAAAAHGVVLEEVEPRQAQMLVEYAAQFGSRALECAPEYVTGALHDDAPAVTRGYMHALPACRAAFMDFFYPPAGGSSVAPVEHLPVRSSLYSPPASRSGGAVLGAAGGAGGGTYVGSPALGVYGGGGAGHEYRNHSRYTPASASEARLWTMSTGTSASGRVGVPPRSAVAHRHGGAYGGVPSMDALLSRGRWPDSPVLDRLEAARFSDPRLLPHPVFMPAPAKVPVKASGVLERYRCITPAELHGTAIMLPATNPHAAQFNALPAYARHPTVIAGVVANLAYAAPERHPPTLGPRVVAGVSFHTIPQKRASSSAAIRAVLESRDFASRFGAGRFAVVRSSRDAAVVHDKWMNKVYVTIRGSDELVKDWIASDAVAFAVGYSRRLDTVIASMVGRTRDHATAAGAEVIVTGHSLGGAMARQVGVLTGHRYVAFDAPHMVHIPAKDDKVATALRVCVDAMFSTYAPPVRHTREDLMRKYAAMGKGFGVEVRLEGDAVSKLPPDFAYHAMLAAEPKGAVDRWEVTVPEESKRIVDSIPVVGGLTRHSLDYLCAIMTGGEWNGSVQVPEPEH